MSADLAAVRAPARRASGLGAGAGRLPEIQGLRALAIGLVVAYHAGLPLHGGFVGVDVFFVISGFVITRLIVNGQAAHGAVRFAEFYRRRIRRLLPALALMLCVVLILSMLLESPIDTQGHTAIAGAGASMWLGNVALFYVTSGYFAPNAHDVVLLHTWSLAVEEQFYLVFPALFAAAYWAAARLRHRAARGYPRAVVGVAVGAVLVLSFLVNLWLCYGQARLLAPQAIAFFFPFGRAWEFAVGALVALAARRAATLPRTVREMTGIAGLAVVLVSALLIRSWFVFPGYVAVFPVVGAGLLIAAVADGPTSVGRLLALRSMRRTGDLSYSIYLWHWPFIALAVSLGGASVWRQCCAAVLSLPVAWASYTYVEAPIRHRRGAPGATRRLLATCVAIPLALCGVLYAGGATAWGSARIHDAQRQVDPKSLNEGHCQVQQDLAARDLARCTYAGDPRRPAIILLGDSDAGEYADGLVRAGRALHRTVVLATTAGCSFNLVEVYLRSQAGGCLRLAQRNLAWLVHQPPAVLVISSANEFVDDGEYALRDPATGRRSSDTAVKGRIWADGLRRLFAALHAAGHTVIQIEVIPHFRSHGTTWTPGTCSFPELLFRYGACGPRQTLAHAQAGHAVGLAAERGAARAAGVAQVDLDHWICPGGRCAVKRGTFWVYRDGMHISVGMSRRLAPVLAREIGSLAPVD